MKCDACLLYLWDLEAKKFRPSQQAGLSHGLLPVFMTEPLDDSIEVVRKALESGDVMIIPPEPFTGSAGAGIKPAVTILKSLSDIKTISLIPLLRQFGKIIPVIKHHHEFYNGTGYPEGLKGDAIPLHARILTVADTVDAMAADRPYRKGKTMDAIIEELKRCSGTQFDPDVVDAFLRKL